MTVPRALPRLLRIPVAEGTIEYVFLHDIVHAYAERLYHGYEILSAAPFRVTRNSNLYLREEESRSILDSVDTQLHRRRKGAAVRLEIEAGADPEIIDRLRSNFRLAPWQVFQVQRPDQSFASLQPLRPDAAPRFEIPPVLPRELAVKPERAALFTPVCASATCCCTIRTIPIPRSCDSSRARRTIPTCFRSSRRSIAPAKIRRSSAR